jgi:hypothetical protein
MVIVVRRFRTWSPVRAMRRRRKAVCGEAIAPACGHTQRDAVAARNSYSHSIARAGVPPLGRASRSGSRWASGNGFTSSSYSGSGTYSYGISAAQTGNSLSVSSAGSGVIGGARRVTSTSVTGRTIPREFRLKFHRLGTALRPASTIRIIRGAQGINEDLTRNTLTGCCRRKCATARRNRGRLSIKKNGTNTGRFSDTVICQATSDTSRSC